MLSVIVLIFILLSNVSYGQNFFEQRYRGWLWFEENEQNNLKDNPNCV
jgi:hypothetical protein